MRHPNIAPCNCRTSQGATRQLRTLRLSHITPCDIAISHPATFACRTVRLKNLAFEPLNPVTHTRRYGHSCLPRSNRLPRHPAAFRHQPQTSPLQPTATSYILDPIQLGLSLLAQLGVAIPHVSDKAFITKTAKANSLILDMVAKYYLS